MNENPLSPLTNTAPGVGATFFRESDALELPT